MITRRLLVLAATFSLFSVALSSAAAAAEQSRPNVLFIAIDDLRNDLGVLGVKHARTPNLDRFAASGRLFTHHYAVVPTCGASRCSLMRGKYPDQLAQVGNEAIRLTHESWGARSLPAWWRKHGYQTLALGKITHYPGNLTGKNWAEGPEELPGAWDRTWIPQSPWKTSEEMMHGYANGQPRVPGKSPAWQMNDGPDEAYPDAWVAGDAVRTLQELSTSNRPWFFAVGLFKPHLPFAAPKKWFDLHDAKDIAAPAVTSRPADEVSGWHPSGEFRGNYKDAAGRDPDRDPAYALELRRAYAAATSYVDAQVGRVLEALRELKLEQNTIVVIWSDHGFLLGEHAIWGKHTLYENGLRSPMMIRVPGMSRAGEKSDALVEAVDLYPTLLELCGLPSPGPLHGRSLRPQLENPAAPALKPARGFWGAGDRTVRTERWRLIAHRVKGSAEPKVELFDMVADPNESRNVAAAQPDVVRELLRTLEDVKDPFATPARP